MDDKRVHQHRNYDNLNSRQTSKMNTVAATVMLKYFKCYHRYRCCFARNNATFFLLHWQIYFSNSHQNIFAAFTSFLSNCNRHMKFSVHLVFAFIIIRSSKLLWFSVCSVFMLYSYHAHFITMQCLMTLLFSPLNLEIMLEIMYEVYYIRGQLTKKIKIPFVLDCFYSNVY